ncbi:hypothetical protein PILCRDRAFT_752618 [Piloderma croceum F 1598]|uniref:Uncharacterized protein n=1 Tax=Piloderma croceum (strain F 1598) TaxID=765440 RepID=A0A0C3EFX9_PILCF|nr:hypothetical protein PILCRDRAFT_752618 [Piloderma croceum F 1598]
MLVKLAAPQNKCTLKEADDKGVPRYLSCLLYISQCLNIFYLVAKPLLKAPKHDHGSEKKKSGFYLFRVTYQKSPRTDPFRKVSCKKTENWHFGDHRIWGGLVSWLHSDICRGPVGCHGRL